METLQYSPSRTLSEQDSIALYLKEISRTKPLTSAQEAALAARIQRGDRGALHELIQANLRFVVSVCRTYQNQGLALADLINEGNLGLVKAAQRFDGKKNFRFISYAVWWIRQSVLQALSEQSRITKVPVNRVGVLHQVGKAQRKLQQRYLRNPDVEEIARELQIDENQVKESLRIGASHVSLDEPVYRNEEKTRYGDLLHTDNEDAPDEQMERISLNRQIHVILNELSEKERAVITLYFGIDSDTAYTLEEIGEKFGLTRERVRQIKDMALRKLKKKQKQRSSKYTR